MQQFVSVTLFSMVRKLFSFRLWLVSMTFAAGLFVAIDAMPTSYWFEYTDVFPKNPPITTQNNIEMVSIRKINRPVHLHYSDILYCDNMDGRYGFFSQLKTDNKLDTSEQKSVIWWYTADTPKIPRRCFIDTRVTHYVFDIFPKEQHLVSDTFLFVNE